MKRINALVGVLLASILLAGCASTGLTSSEGANVKCPVCGYEFNEPSDA